MTHTYVTMEVSESTYSEVKEKLLAAGYSHAINDEGELDMHGIALIEEEENILKVNLKANIPPSIDYKGKNFTLEAKIIYVLVKRLGGSVNITTSELKLSNDENGLVVQRLRNDSYSVEVT